MIKAASSSNGAQAQIRVPSSPLIPYVEPIIEMPYYLIRSATQEHYAGFNQPQLYSEGDSEHKGPSKKRKYSEMCSS